MSKFINTIDTLGDDTVVDSIIQKTITEFRDNVVTWVKTGSFNGCTKLEIVDFASTIKIGGQSFADSTNLASVILRSETLCTLMHTNAFTNTPISKGTGYIYAPQALIDEYKVATNWSTLANQFRALEDYTVDGTTTGALDESKI